MRCRARQSRGFGVVAVASHAPSDEGFLDISWLFNGNILARELVWCGTTS